MLSYKTKADRYKLFRNENEAIRLTDINRHKPIHIQSIHYFSYNLSPPPSYKPPTPYKTKFLSLPFLVNPFDLISLLLNTSYLTSSSFSLQFSSSCFFSDSLYKIPISSIPRKSFWPHLSLLLLTPYLSSSSSSLKFSSSSSCFFSLSHIFQNSPITVPKNHFKNLHIPP